MRIYCCCCGKQAIDGPVSRYDQHVTKIDGGRTGFKKGEIFCGYCAEEMDENGLFPEEQAQAYNDE